MAESLCLVLACVRLYRVILVIHIDFSHHPQTPWVLLLGAGAFLLAHRDHACDRLGRVHEGPGDIDTLLGLLLSSQLGA